MSAPGCSTFDGNPTIPTTNGYRPGFPDFNGAACVDVTASPPKPPTQGTAACWNTFGATLVSCGKMIAVANIAVNAAVSATLASYATAANQLATNPFTLLRVGIGHYQITWPANTFPITGWPKAYCNASTAATTTITAANMTNGVEVWTTQAGAAADVPFNVDLF